MSSGRRISNFLAALTLAGGVGVCSAPLWAQQTGGTLLAQDVAARHGLVRAWWRQVDLDSARDRIESLTLHDDTLYVQTKRGTISALDAETGRVRWVRQVGSPDYFTAPVGASNDFAAVVNGTTVYVLTRDEGKTFMEHRTVNVPGGPPAMTKDNVFIPSLKGALEGYSIRKIRQPPWLYSSSGRAMVQPYVTTDSISWSTNRGFFYVASVEPPALRFRVEAHDEIVALPGYRAPYLYFGSLDGHVYKVHELRGNIVWRFAAGEPVDERPLVFDDRLFVSSRHGGLYCVVAEAPEVAADVARPGQALPAQEGSEVWRYPGVTRLLAASKTRLYGLDRDGKLTVLRRADGGYVDALSLAKMELSVPNDVTDRIYLASRLGTIQCLHEVGLDKPLLHRAEVKPAAKAAVQKGLEDLKPKGGAKKKGAAEDDLFGADKKEEADKAPGGGNPFGGDVFGGEDKAKTDKKAGGKKAKGDGAGGMKPKDEGNDPFGGDAK